MTTIKRTQGVLLLAILCFIWGAGLARDQVPGRLGALVLGKAPPVTYISGQGDGSPVQAYYVEDRALADMWSALAPGMPNAVELGTISTYKGRVAQVVFALRSDVKFETAHRYFTTRFGKGQKANVRTPTTQPNVVDCPRQYLIQRWSAAGNALTIISSKNSGVHVVLRHSLAREMDRDPNVEREGECIEI